MLDEMQVANALTIDMDKAHVFDNLLVDFLIYVSYMSSKVAMQFPPRSGGGGKHKFDLRISKLDSNRRCGGGRVGFCSQVRGGHGIHHSVSDKHDPANGWFHGVDCSKFRRCLSGEESDKARSNGCLYVFNKRNSDNDTRHIQKVKQCRNDDGREQSLVPYSGEINGNDNSGGNGNPNESKRHRSAQGKGGGSGSRLRQGAYKPT